MGLWFWCHFIHNAYWHTHARVHSKNMSQDVFMALLLCSLTGRKIFVLKLLLVATANFFHLRNFTWISAEILFSPQVISN